MLVANEKLPRLSFLLRKRLPALKRSDKRRPCGPVVTQSITEARRMLDHFEQFAMRTACAAHRPAVREAVAAARRRLNQYAGS